MDYLKIVSDQYNLNRETDKRDCLLLFNNHLNGQMAEDYKYACNQADNIHPYTTLLNTQTDLYHMTLELEKI